MAMTIHVDIVSAEKSLYSGIAEVVIAPGQRGELGIYPRHTPLLTTLKPGAVRIKVPNQAEEELVYVSGGILEVQPHIVTILSDSAIRGADLDEAKALEARLHELLGWFTAHDIEVKGAAPIIIDFPAQLLAAPVLLCWLEGEAELAWYHRAELGFLGRRRLPPEAMV